MGQDRCRSVKTSSFFMWNRDRWIKECLLADLERARYPLGKHLGCCIVLENRRQEFQALSPCLRLRSFLNYSVTEKAKNVFESLNKIKEFEYICLISYATFNFTMCGTYATTKLGHVWFTHYGSQLKFCCKTSKINISNKCFPNSLQLNV